MKPVHLQKIIKEVRDAFRCPQCGKKFPLKNIEFKGSVGGLYFLTMRCTNHVPVAVMVRVSDKEGELKFEQQVEITENDALDFGRAIERYEGRLSDLL
jgi:hypothetical protein